MFYEFVAIAVFALVLWTQASSTDVHGVLCFPEQVLQKQEVGDVGKQALPGKWAEAWPVQT